MPSLYVMVGFLVVQRLAAAALGESPRPARWAAALAELRTLQAEYETWRDQLPESLAESRTDELLEGVCDVDLDALERRAAAGVRTRLRRPRMRGSVKPSYRRP